MTTRVARKTAGVLMLFILCMGSMSAQQSAQFTEWQLPEQGSSPFQIAAGAGFVFSTDITFVGTGLGRIHQLNLNTNTFTSWILPSYAASSPADIAIHVNESGNLAVFVVSAIMTTNAIGRLDPSTQTFARWPLPPGVGGPRDFALDASGNVFFTATGGATGHRIGKLEPSANKMTVWTIPPSLGVPIDNFIAGSDLTNNEDSLLIRVYANRRRA